MADRIGDFRDEDSEPEPLGAEDEAYLGAGLAQGAADQPFATESELLGVLGMTQSLYQQIRPYVTVYSGAEGIDPTRAPRPVLEALPGITPSVVEALLAAGREVDPFSVIEDQELLADLEEYIVPSRELMFTIRALGRTSGGGRFLRQAVIELDSSLTGLSWFMPGAVGLCPIPLAELPQLAPPRRERTGLDVCRLSP